MSHLSVQICKYGGLSSSCFSQHGFLIPRVSMLESFCKRLSLPESGGSGMPSHLSYVLESSGQTQAPHSPGSRVDTSPVPAIPPSRKTCKSNQSGRSCLSSLSSGFKILHTPKHICDVKLNIFCVRPTHSTSRYTAAPQPRPLAATTHIPRYTAGPTPWRPPLAFLLPRHQSGLSSSRRLLCLAPFVHCNASVIPTSTQFLFLLHNIPLGRHSSLCLSRRTLKGNSAVSG